jgi:hypothetical protein
MRGISGAQNGAVTAYTPILCYFTIIRQVNSIVIMGKTAGFEKIFSFFGKTEAECE